MTIASKIRKQIDRLEYKILPRQYFKNKVYILLYHSVSREKHYLLEDMSDSIFVDLEQFAKQINFIYNNYPIISIGDYIQGRTESESVIINFDDGFKDTYTHAYPILKQLKIPFTICINSQFMNNRDFFWLSKINYLKKHGLLDEFLETASVSLPITKLLNNKVLNGQIDEFLTARALDPRSIAKESNLYLSDDDILNMPPELLTILPHTHTHYKTTDLTYSERKEEIEKSIAYCKKKFPDHYRPIFSFPFGAPGLTFDETDISILNENNINYYLSAVDGINRFPPNNFEIKRKSVFRSQSLDTFKYFIEKPQVTSKKIKSIFGLTAS